MRCHHREVAYFWSKKIFDQNFWSKFDLDIFGQKCTLNARWFSFCLLFHPHHQQPGGRKGALAGFPVHGCLRCAPLDFFNKGKAANSSPEPLSLLLQVTISTSRGSWLLSRVFERGYPWDMVSITRLKTLIKTSLPGALSWSLTNHKVNKRFNHKNYGLQPDSRYFLVLPIPCRWVGRGGYSAASIN